MHNVLTHNSGVAFKYILVLLLRKNLILEWITAVKTKYILKIFYLIGFSRIFSFEFEIKSIVQVFLKYIKFDLIWFYFTLLIKGKCIIIFNTVTKAKGKAKTIFDTI